MTVGALARRGIAGLLLVSAVTLAPVLTAGISIPSSSASQTGRAIGANDLKPSQCSSVTVATKVQGSAVVTGTAAGDLITASAAIDSISGLGGTDCILGGGGADTIDGGLGTDVCIGGPGTDIFLSCETQIQ